MLKALVFDVGRVLLEVAPVEPLVAKIDGIDDEETFWKQWILLEAVRDFETGKISEADFVKGVLDEMKVQLSAEEFFAEFDRWPLKLYDQVEEVVSGISDHYEVATMSNMNARHWQIVLDDFGLGRMIEKHFPSWQTALMKPDSAAYENVARQLDLSIDEIAFFDDNQLNVDGAKAAGMQAYRVKGADELQTCLQNLKIL